MAGVIGIFIATSYSGKAREKYGILKITDGKKHFYVLAVIILLLLAYGSGFYQEIKTLPKSLNTFYFSCS